MKILIINTGGNISSLMNILNFCGYEAKIYEDRSDLKSYDLFFLPGIGTFDNSIKTLMDLKIHDDLKNFDIIKKKKIIGICVGMQILFNKSEEGSLKGLSLIDGEIRKFKDLHMGWNEIYSNENNELLDDNLFYFAHNFYADCEKKFIHSYCKHSIEFPAIVKKDNIYGIQFHPEKSHINGINLFKRILNEKI